MVLPLRLPAFLFPAFPVPQKIKRELKRKQAQLDSAKALLPMSRSELRDVQADLEQRKAQAKQVEGRLRDARQEVDMFIHNYLKQEGVEKKKKESLEELLRVRGR